MAKTNPQIKAENREILGKKVKHLRAQGETPATVYGKDFKSVSVKMDTRELEQLFSEVGESGLVDVEIGKDRIPILFRNPQYHPVSGDLMHIDLYKVNLKEKIVATVPIELVGESEAVEAGNTLVEVTNEIEVEALPAELPEKIEVDISVLKTLEDMITVGDLKLGDKITVQTPTEMVIAKVEEPREEEEIPVEPEVAPGEVPATEQKPEGEEGEAEDKEKPKEEKEEKSE